MRARRASSYPAVLACLCIFATLSACNREEPEARYRLLVEVETPEGLRRGSSVIGLRRREVRTILSSDGRRTLVLVNGEAAAVDLPNGRTLFALLSQLGFPDHVKYMLPGTNPIRGEFRSVEPVKYPMLVTFKDPGDPSSVVQVSPNALEERFGPGYRLRRVAVARTDDPVTREITRRLPWLRNMTGSLNGQMFQGGDLAGQLTSVNFRRAE